MQDSGNHDRLMSIGIVTVTILLVASGWVAYFVSNSHAKTKEADLQRQVSAASADYNQKEQLAHLTDKELAAKTAQAYYDARVEVSSNQKLSNFRTVKLQDGFATVFADTPVGGGPATYLKKVDGTWAIILSTNDPLDPDTRTRYGIPKDY